MRRHVSETRPSNEEVTYEKREERTGFMEDVKVGEGELSVGLHIEEPLSHSGCTELCMPKVCFVSASTHKALSFARHPEQ